MIRVPKLMWMALIGLSVAGAETLTQGERDRAMSHLHGTRKLLIDAASGLSAKQLEFKAAPEKWSIADVVEHLATTESFLFGMLKNQIMTSPAAPEKKELVKGKDEALIKSIANRDQKFQAPEPLVPKKRFATTAEALAEFKTRRAETIKYVETTDGDLRSHFMNAPDGSPMDAYQVLLLLSAHTERHVKQIVEVKEAPGYPKK